MTERIGRKSDAAEERYRLYIDESGDHVFRETDAPSHRYLCLLGCWFGADHYIAFHRALETLKQHHFPHHPDDPVILHREDIVNCRGAFWRLRDDDRRRAFDEAFLSLVSDARFTAVAVVIDKKALVDRYTTPAHPYHLAMGFMLQRFCGWLNHVNRRGDVMAESRGKREDRLLKGSYEFIYERGVWRSPASFFQQALTSKQLKVKPKSANIAGLQLSDLLSHPVKGKILAAQGHHTSNQSEFIQRLLGIARWKFNRHLYSHRIEGYGEVFFPTEK